MNFLQKEVLLDEQIIKIKELFDAAMTSQEHNLSKHLNMPKKGSDEILCSGHNLAFSAGTSMKELSIEQFNVRIFLCKYSSNLLFKHDSLCLNVTR